MAWVLGILVAAWLFVSLVPWGGVLVSKRNHERVGTALGSSADFLIVGDSKTGPFESDCLMRWFPPYKGAVFSADSVTPVYHLDTLRHIRSENPDFAPDVVFIFVGANNLNTNGLHASRDYTFFNLLPLSDVYTFSAGRGEWGLFAEAIFSRLLPVYGTRIMITHLQVGGRGARACPTPDRDSFPDQPTIEFDFRARNPVADRNYLEIYRRSMYANYESSPVQLAALEEMIELVREWGGKPIVVFPPVTTEVRELEDELIGMKFDESVASVLGKSGTPLLDLRDDLEFEFKDVNHLSPKGAFELSRERLLPVIAESVGEGD